MQNDAENANNVVSLFRGGSLVDRDQVADAVISYVQARSHAAGARGWADLVPRDHHDHLAAQRRAVEASEVAGGYLHALAMSLYAEPGDSLAHEVFVERLELALREGWTAGWDGQPAEIEPLGFVTQLDGDDL